VTARIDPRLAAEDAQAYLPSRPSTVRLDAADIALRHHPHFPQHRFGSATRPRFAHDAVDRRVAEVRAWFRGHGRREFTWMVGGSATPPNLVDRLLELGARMDPDDPDGDAMVLDHEPPPAPEGVTIRRIATFDEYVASMRLVMEDATAEQWAQMEAGLPAAWEEARVDDRMYGFLALVDGEPIAFAQMVWLTNGFAYLGGAHTKTTARGHGAFRALVRARWDDAVRHDSRVLLVQAGRMSSPILARLGFERVGRVQTLIDRSD
jgi:acetyltransferase (GNAT) family protein